MMEVMVVYHFISYLLLFFNSKQLVDFKVLCDHFQKYLG